MRGVSENRGVMVGYGSISALGHDCLDQLADIHTIYICIAFPSILCKNTYARFLNKSDRY